MRINLNKVFICTDHAHVWPTGVCSIVVARNKDEARKLLDEKLHEAELETWQGKPYSLKEIDTQEPYAEILVDGDY